MPSGSSPSLVSAVLWLQTGTTQGARFISAQRLTKVERESAVMSCIERLRLHYADSPALLHGQAVALPPLMERGIALEH